MLIRDGLLWQLNEQTRPDSDFFIAFITPHWNEALNPNAYAIGTRARMRALLRARCPDVVDWYRDERGRRLSARQFAQNLGRAPSPTAEAEGRSFHDVTRMEYVADDAIHESCRVLGHERRFAARHHRQLHSAFRDVLKPFLHCAEAGRRLGRRNYAQRMGVEREHDGGHPRVMRELGCSMEQLLMGAVNPVEIPDRKNRSFDGRRNGLKSKHRSHKSSQSLREQTFCEVPR